MGIRSSKIIFILSIMFFTEILYSFTIPQTGIIDEAKCLVNGEKKIGGYAGFEAYYFKNIALLEYPNKKIFIPPIYIQNVLSDYVSLVPTGSLGFLYQLGLRSRSELSFSSLILSPTASKMNFYGPGITFNFGWKKNIFQTSLINFSYKLDSGMFYNAQPGGGVYLKSSIIIGSNGDKTNHNGILAWETILSGQQMSFIKFVYSLEYFNFTNSFIAEYNFSVNRSNGFVYNMGIYIQYSINLDISQYLVEGDENTYEYFFNYYYYYNKIYSYDKIVGILHAGIKFTWSKKYMKQQKE